MSVRKITLGLALAAVSTLGLAGATATSSEAHHRHHHHHFFRAGLFYGPAYYAYNYAPCGWVWTRRGRAWYCY